MSDTWYYARGGQQLGPVSWDALAAMLRSGEVMPGDLVWREGMPQWLPANTVPETAREIPQAVAAAPGQLVPGYAGPPMPGGPGVLGYSSVIEPPQYAGLWLRFVAAFVDGIITNVGGAILGLIVGGIIGGIMGASGASQNEIASAVAPVAQVLGIVVAWLYHALMESSPKQATLGKMAVGLVVTDVNGARIGFGRATGRYFGKIPSALILGIGFIMAGFTARKQALHDIMAGTLVMKIRR